MEAARKRTRYCPAPGSFWTARSEKGTGCFALCGERPETLSLDSAAFEKAGETFNLRYAPVSQPLSTVKIIGTIGTTHNSIYVASNIGVSTL